MKQEGAGVPFSARKDHQYLYIDGLVCILMVLYIDGQTCIDSLWSHLVVEFTKGHAPSSVFSEFFSHIGFLYNNSLQRSHSKTLFFI